MGLLSVAIWLPIISGAVLLALGRDEQAGAVRWLALVAAIAGAMTGRRQVARKLDDTVDYRGSALKR